MIQFDCHAHVYESIRAVVGARYVPDRPAPLSEWLGCQQDHGLKGGVIVQVSFLGTDNSQMCTALSRLDRSRFAGVGVVPLDVRADELDRLVLAGMRGVRWNLVGGASIPDLNSAITKAFLHNLRDRALHLEIHLEGPVLAPLLPALSDLGVNLVIDHFGLPSDPNPANDPMLKAVSGLSDHQALFFKFAAHYRLPFDIQPHAEELMNLLPADHVVWGSDWPHTQHESRANYAQTYALTSLWSGLSDQTAVQTLYGLTLA